MIIRAPRLIVTGTLLQNRTDFENEVEREYRRVRELVAEASKSGKADQAFLDQLSGNRLTTAEILYEMPDIKGLFQLFIWQCMDMAPKFPTLHKFLDFWQRNLDGKVHSVRVAGAELFKPAEFNTAGAMFSVH